MSEIDYQSMKQRHADELNSFDGIFFAFSNKQFEEGLAKVGGTAKDLCRLPGGGFIRKDRSNAFSGMFKRHEAERKACMSNRKALLDALSHELANHEYCITLDPTDALEALGLSRDDVPVDILKKARRNACREVACKSK